MATDLRNLAGRTFEYTELSLESRGTRLIEADGSCPEISGDPAHVRQWITAKVLSGEMREVLTRSTAGGLSYRYYAPPAAIVAEMGPKGLGVGPCACKGTLPEEASHSMASCNGSKISPEDGSRAEIHVYACQCLRATCEICEARPSIDAERALVMRRLDSGEWGLAPDPVSPRPDASPDRYSPDRLIGGIITIPRR